MFSEYLIVHCLLRIHISVFVAQLIFMRVDRLLGFLLLQVACGEADAAPVRAWATKTMVQNASSVLQENGGQSSGFVAALRLDFPESEKVIVPYAG